MEGVGRSSRGGWGNAGLGPEVQGRVVLGRASSAHSPDSKPGKAGDWKAGVRKMKRSWYKEPGKEEPEREGS